MILISSSINKKFQSFDLEQVNFPKMDKYAILYRIFDGLFAPSAQDSLLMIYIYNTHFIKKSSPHDSIFFTQRRLGLDGKLFNVYKFRTMIPNAEAKLNELLIKDKSLKEEYLKFRKLKNDPRIIPHIGNFLRKSSLDELPQFINVLLGQMSVVGPRPYIENEFSIFSHRLELKVITAVKPGVTGYWQVIPERHETTFEERVRKDIEYIEKKSFLLDLKIISKTFSVMILRKGA